MAAGTFDKASELLSPGAPLAANGSGTGSFSYPRMFPMTDWVIYASGVVATGTYTFNLQVSDVIGGTYTTIASMTWPPTLASGQFHIPINGDAAGFFDNDSRYVRINYAIGGTTPGAVVGSYLTKPVNKAGYAYKPGDLVTVS